MKLEIDPKEIEKMKNEAYKKNLSFEEVIKEKIKKQELIQCVCLTIWKNTENALCWKCYNEYKDRKRE